MYSAGAVTCQHKLATFAEAAHLFSSSETDWGFTTFANQSEVLAPTAGVLVNDTLRLNVVVRVDRPEDLSYDSKKSTGYVGLKNQGATCYMNSLLQTLYNINYFRQVKSCAMLRGAQFAVLIHPAERSTDSSPDLLPLRLHVFMSETGSLSHCQLHISCCWPMKAMLLTAESHANAGCVSYAYTRGGDACQQHSAGLAKHLLQGEVSAMLIPIAWQSAVCILVMTTLRLIILWCEPTPVNVCQIIKALTLHRNPPTVLC